MTDTGQGLRLAIPSQSATKDQAESLALKNLCDIVFQETNWPLENSLTERSLSFRTLTASASRGGREIVDFS